MPKINSNSNSNFSVLATVFGLVAREILRFTANVSRFVVFQLNSRKLHVLVDC